MIHLIPINDERPHIEDTYCWCDPTIIYGDDNIDFNDTKGPIVRHNAADCREIVEEAIGGLSEPGKYWKVIIYE